MIAAGKTTLLLISLLLFLVSCDNPSDSNDGDQNTNSLVPEAPTVFEASSGTYSDSIVLTWRLPTSGPSADSIVIYRSFSSDGSYSRLAAIVLGTSYSDKTAEKDRVFYYKVTAKNSSGESAFSNYDEGHLGESGGQENLIPYGIQVSLITDGLNVMWSIENSDQIEYFTLEKYLDTNGSPIDTDTLYTSTIAPGGSLAIEDSFTDLTKFYYRVTAYTSDGSYAHSIFTMVDMTLLITQEIPEAPYNLMASMGTYDSLIVLNWALSGENHDGYILYRKTGESSSLVAETLSIAPTALTYSDTVAPFDTVYYMLATYNSAGVSELSEIAKGYSGIEVSIEYSMTLALLRADAVEITCTSLTDTKYSYLLYRADDLYGTFTQISAEPFDSLYIDSINVNAGYTYVYKSRAIAGTDTSELSDSYIQITTLQAAPTNLQVQSVNSHSAVITWDGTKAAANYSLYIKDASNSIDTFLVTNSGTFQLPDSTLMANSTYSFWMHATPPQGINAIPAISDTASFTSLYSYTGTLTVSDDNPAGIDITWSPLMVNGAVASEQYAQLYRKVPGASIFTLYQDNVTDTFYLDTDVAKDENYSYYVVMRTPANLSESSDTVTGTKPGFPEPDSIWALSGEVGYIDIFWKSVTDAASYKLVRSEKYDTLWDTIATVTDTTYRDGNIYNGLEYYYGIVAVSSTGVESEVTRLNRNSYSNAQGDFIVGNLAATTTASSVTLSWTPTTASGVTYNDFQYIIYRSTGGSAVSQVKVLSGSLTSWTDEAVTTGATYQYTVVAQVKINNVVYTSGNGATVSDVIPQ